MYPIPIAKLETATEIDETLLTKPQKKALIAAFNILKPNYDIHARKINILYVHLYYCKIQEKGSASATDSRSSR